jgi:hypothetical protein
MKPVLVWNSKSLEFALVSDSLARAMMACGSLEGFDRASANPAVGSVTLEQTSDKCRVIVDSQAGSLWQACGRVEAKKTAKALHKMTGCTVYNVKKGGARVQMLPAA